METMEMEIHGRGVHQENDQLDLLDTVFVHFYLFNIDLPINR